MFWGQILHESSVGSSHFTFVLLEQSGPQIRFGVWARHWPPDLQWPLLPLVYLMTGIPSIPCPLFNKIPQTPQHLTLSSFRSANPPPSPLWPPSVPKLFYRPPLTPIFKMPLYLMCVKNVAAIFPMQNLDWQRVTRGWARFGPCPAQCPQELCLRAMQEVDYCVPSITCTSFTPI